ncbi:metallophosphoesterase [Ligilactobacillus ruminis]|uniref:metallophosphoesterase n=1 Tax=Ligilactobacillus ruminis TaxID=1623 RepID=UPI003F951732
MVFIATYVISDIHGQYDMLMELIDKIDLKQTDTFVITGHTPTQTIEDNPRPGFIYRNNNHIAIDCGAHYPGGRLVAICLETGEEFYSSPNEMGVSIIC